MRILFRTAFLLPALTDFAKPEMFFPQELWENLCTTFRLANAGLLETWATHHPGLPPDHRDGYNR